MNRFIGCLSKDGEQALVRKYTDLQTQRFSFFSENLHDLAWVQAVEPPRRLSHETGGHAVEIPQAPETDAVHDLGHGKADAYQKLPGLVDAGT
jgi:hypothetical protein